MPYLFIHTVFILPQLSSYVLRIFQQHYRLLVISFVYTQSTGITLVKQLFPHAARAVYYFANEHFEYSHAIYIILYLSLQTSDAYLSC